MMDFRKNKPRKQAVKNGIDESVFNSTPPAKENIFDRKDREAKEAAKEVKEVEEATKEVKKVIPINEKPSSKEIDAIDREIIVMRRLMDDHKLFVNVADKITAAVFQNEAMQKIWSTIRRLYYQLNRKPTIEEIAFELSLIPSGGEKKLFSIVMGSDPTVTTSDLVLDHIEYIIQHKEIEEAIANVACAVHEMGDNKIDPEIISALFMAGANKTKFQLKEIDALYDHDLLKYRDLMLVTSDPIPSALSDVCNYTTEFINRGGWYTGLSVFMGMPNVGKTLLLCNEAAHAYKNGYNVLYISLETDTKFIYQNIMCNALDMTKDDFRMCIRDDAKLKEYQQLVDGIKGTCTIERLNSTVTNANNIASIINDIRLSRGIKIDVCYIDYIGLMKPAIPTSKNATLYEDGKMVAEELRELSLSVDIPIVTASQFNREGYSRTKANMQNTAGSVGLNDTADFIMTITTDADLEPYDLLSHTIIKNRHGEKNITVYTKLDKTKVRATSATASDMALYTTNTISKELNILNNKAKKSKTDETRIAEIEADLKSIKQLEIDRVNKIIQGIIEKEKLKKNI